MLRNPFRDLDQKQLNRSSDILKSQNDYFKIVNKRIFIFSLIIVILFSCIIVRLLFLQVRDKELYTDKLAAYSQKEESTPTPRGQMYDRNGNLVVKTASSHNIIYYPPKDVTSDEKWELAQKFTKQFKYEAKNMTKSDYEDLYMFLHTDENGKKDRGMSLLTPEEQKSKNYEKILRSRITEDMVNEIADEATKNAFAVYLSMNKAPAEHTKVIVEDASNEDVAYLMEHKEAFPGFDVDFGSWKREYPYKNMLRDVLGSVTTSSQGVPYEQKDYYESLGYALTDRVGSSGLEKQYESILKGTPRVSEVSFDENGIATLNEVSSGKKGYDLHLTIDAELQSKVDKIVQDTLKKYAGTSGRENLEKAFVVLMNPKTGEIYSMSGALKNKNDIINYSSGAYLDAYMPGSVVKGATVYMMLNEGIQTRTSTELDAPMYIAGTEVMKSYMNMGVVNAITALEQSSNVYMFKSTIKLAGGTYRENQPLNIDYTQTLNTYEKMRNYYTMFGLGTKTGLDVPNEVTGLAYTPTTAGQLLHYSIGQFETFTPIQLAQYVSMIANDGNRIQPKLVNYATEINSDYVVYENKTNVLGTINGSIEDLETVQDGFKACVEGNHCGLALKNMDKKIASKTGTAQVVVDGKNLVNQTQIGYAPYDDPEVSFVCSTPTSANDTSNAAASLCTTEILPQVLEEFFKIYK